MCASAKSSVETATIGVVKGDGITDRIVFRGVSKLTSFAAVLALTLFGCGGSDEAQRQRQSRAVPVETAVVVTDTMRETVRGVGSLRASARVEIKPEVAGIVARVALEQGGPVKQGQMLFQLDDRKLQQQLDARRAALEAAEARLANARRILERTERLFKNRVASRDEYDEATTNFDEASAEVQRLSSEIDLVQEQLRDTRIRAPLPGVLSESEVDQGDYVDRGDQLATLYKITPLEISFTLPERFMGRVDLGQEVRTSVAAFSNRAFEGEIFSVSPAVDEATRDFTVKARIRNPDRLLKPGGFASAIVTVEVLENRPVVPEDALVATREGYLVFVVEGDTARQRDVGIGLRAEGLVEIREGLRPGETVVTSGQMNLADGAKIRVRGPAPATEIPETSMWEGREGSRDP